MKVLEKAAMWGFATIALAAMAFAAGQDLPAGDAKPMVEKTCTACHDAGPIMQKKQSKEEWTDTVKSMQSYGAQVSDKDFVTIVDYLTKNFGKGDAAPAGDAAKAKSPADDFGLPAGEGRDLVATTCTACHDLENVKMKKASKDEWSDIVNSMVSYGAKVSDPEFKTITEYLSKAFPK